MLFSPLNPDKNKEVEELEAAIKQNERLLAQRRKVLADLKKSQESPNPKQPEKPKVPAFASDVGCDPGLDRALKRLFES